MAQEEDEGKGKGEDTCDEEVAAEVADEEGGVYAKRLYEEAADGVQAHVEQGDITIFEAVRESPRDEEEYKADEDVPDGLVEKRRVESDFASEA